MKAFIEAALPWIVMGIYVAVIAVHGRGMEHLGGIGCRRGDRSLL